MSYEDPSYTHETPFDVLAPVTEFSRGLQAMIRELIELRSEVDELRLYKHDQEKKNQERYLQSQNQIHETFRTILHATANKEIKLNV